VGNTLKNMRTLRLIAANLAVLAGLIALTSLARADESYTCETSLKSDPDALSYFLRNECYKADGWGVDAAVRQTGPTVDGAQYGTHGNVRIHYPPEVYQWLLNDRPKDIVFSDGTIVVKEQYSGVTYAEPGELGGWTIMLKQSDASYDGWYWGYIDKANDDYNFTEFFLPYCINCHAGADNDQLLFSSLSSIQGDYVTYASIDTIAPDVDNFDSHRPIQRFLTDLPQPLSKPDEAFLVLYDAIKPVDPKDVLHLPSQTFDHVVPRAGEPQHFITSDVCAGCHDADSELKGVMPEMITQNSAGTNINLSPYGEWSGSVMGLAGRDPIFHAQLESEKALQPELSDYIDNFCYRCHGVAGQRQLQIDSGGEKDFVHAMIYATGDDPDAQYGALARDGITCTSCHHISDEALGEASTFTALFNTGPADVLYGPFEDPKAYAMHQTTGVSPEHAPWMSESKTCGTCHTVILPVLDVDGEYTPETANAAPTVHEQATYLEWLNSAYQNVAVPVNQATAQTCQDCHMTTTFEGEDLAFRIANIQDTTYPYSEHLAAADLVDLEVRAPFARHTLLGINLFAMSMFQQFPDVLGLVPNDVNLDARIDPALSLLFAAEQSEELATTATTSVTLSRVTMGEDTLEAVVVIDNLTGHRFPSGVGFRRAFLEFTVLDADGEVLWQSGGSSPLGVILGSDGKPLPTEFSETEVAPHYETITSEDQAQVYETRHLDSNGKLTTSFLALKTEVKDNRLMPLGWDPDGPSAEFTSPHGVDGDDRYLNGSGGDTVTFVIPLDAIQGAATVRTALHYQTIPPYYLQDRFTVSQGPETERLHYLTSHLATDGTAIENWSITVGQDEALLQAN
jgi:hypothetical protein